MMNSTSLITYPLGCLTASTLLHTDLESAPQTAPSTSRFDSFRSQQAAPHALPKDYTSTVGLYHSLYFVVPHGEITIFSTHFHFDSAFFIRTSHSMPEILYCALCMYSPEHVVLLCTWMHTPACRDDVDGQP